MIRLAKVSLALREKGVAPAPILNSVFLALPTNSRVCILGGDQKFLTEILLLLAGMRRPDSGWIDSENIRHSPVVNAGSAAGRTLVPQLTAIDNIRMMARTHGVDEDTLIALVESACKFGEKLWVSVNNFDRPMRRRLEATLIGAIPFDCYYIDRLHEFEGPLIWQFIHMAKLRNAGIFFTTRMPKQVREFAQFGAMVRNGSLELLDSLRDAFPAELNEVTGS